MKFCVLTLFPEMIRQGMNASIIGRAVENGLIEIEAVNIRDYSADKHGSVDDYTYGGGAGMLMQAQPVYDAWNAVWERGGQRARTIYVTPQGTPFTQRLAEEFSKEEELIFLCGHYEGVDERVLEEIVTDYVSIGDYVLTGGELPAMVMMDAIARLVPGVLHNEESSQTESFYNDLLEYPQYSRPEIWHGKSVPQVLLSGDHRKIAEWRRERAKERTRRMRPDLYERYLEKERFMQQLSQKKRQHIHMIESLARGRAEVLYTDGSYLLLQDIPLKHYMLCQLRKAADAAQEPENEDLYKMIGQIPADAAELVVFRKLSKGLPGESAGQWVETECRQACYTQKNHLPVRHKDIRRLSAQYLDYLSKHYDQKSALYLKERIDAGALYGAFLGEQIVGFMGFHADGRLGMLYVEPDARRQGIGASLEAFCINLHVAAGYVPYGHIEVGNTPALRLQEQLGLYLAADSIWRYERR